jgi:hypothetical protein
MKGVLSNISPHAVGATRICSECCQSVPVKQAVVHSPVPGLTMYHCPPCAEKAKKS